MNRKAVRVLNTSDSDVGKNPNTGLPALGFEHGHNILRRAVTEKLSESFFVISDAVLFDQSDEVRRRVRRKRRFGEVRIARNKVFRLTVQVGEVAAAATRNEDLFADASGAFQYCHTPSALPCLDGAHQPRRTAAENDEVKFVFHDLRRNDQRRPCGAADSPCTSERKSAGGSQSMETVSPERGWTNSKCAA